MNGNPAAYWKDLAFTMVSVAEAVFPAPDERTAVTVIVGTSGTASGAE